MDVGREQGRVQEEMLLLEKEVEKRDSDIQQLQKQLKEAEHILVGTPSTTTSVLLYKYNIVILLLLPMPLGPLLLLLYH
jgi:hypothetical protein